MSWINTHRRVWRVAFLVLLVVALSGTWAFDLISAPSPYFTCSGPNIRLSDDFCGMPISVIGWLTIILFPLIGHFGDIIAGLFTGEVSPAEFLVNFFLPFLPLLPFLTTLFLMPGGERRRWHIFHLVVLGLAAGYSLFAGLASLPRPHPVLWLWGLWLYLGLTAGMLLLEMLAFAASRRPAHE